MVHQRGVEEAEERSGGAQLGRKYAAGHAFGLVSLGVHRRKELGVVGAIGLKPSPQSVLQTYSGGGYIRVEVVKLTGEVAAPELLHDGATGGARLRSLQTPSLVSSD